MRLLTTFWLFTIVLLATTANAGSPATMRVDYFHTGNSESELFSLDQVVVEPLAWSGNMHQPIDRTQMGKLLTDRRTDLLEQFISKWGKPFQAWLVLDDKNKVAFEFPEKKEKDSETTDASGD